MSGLSLSYKRKPGWWSMAEVKYFQAEIFKNKKHNCADCRMCQFCSDSRCNKCRSTDKKKSLSFAEQIALYDKINQNDDTPPNQPISICGGTF